MSELLPITFNKEHIMFVSFSILIATLAPLAPLAQTLTASAVVAGTIADDRHPIRATFVSGPTTTPELVPVDSIAMDPASASIILPSPEPEDMGERAYERLVRSVWGFKIDQASRHADRLMQVGTPAQQMCGFFLALRSEAWLDSIRSDGPQFASALEILDRALAVRARTTTSEEFDQESLDHHVALLDEAIGNSLLAVQRARSCMHAHEIDAAFAKLRDARPWYWFDNRPEEIASAASLVPAFRDQLLVDLFTEGRLNQFHEELTSADRSGLSMAAGLIDGTGTHIVVRRGAARIHGEGRLIPEYARVFDASTARILEPIGPQRAAAALAEYRR